MVDFLYRFRFALLGILAGLCVVAWPGVRAAGQLDNSLAVWFLRDDPALRAYRDFQARFGNDEVVIVVVHQPAPGGLLSSSGLTLLRNLTRELRRVPGVALVSGAGAAAVPRAGPLGTTEATPLLDSAATAASVRAALATQPTLREQLFTPDYRTARLVVTLRAVPDFDTRRAAILARLDTVARVAARHAHAEVYLGGVGVVYAGLNALSEQDFGFFLGVGYLLVFLGLGLLYRNLLLLLYAVSIVALSTWLTLGMYGTLGYRLNLMSVLLPVLIILLGVMDAMHVINERNLRRAAGASAHDSALGALRSLLRPCVATMLTTTAGFLALLTAPMPILRSFGAFAAVGIALCLVLTYVLGVALLPLVPGRGRVTPATSIRLVRFYQLVLRHRRLGAAVALGLIGFLALGATRLRADTYTLGYLPATHRVVQDHWAIERTWGHYLPLELLVQPRAGHALSDPAVVRAALAFADSARVLTGGGRVFGFPQLYLAGLEAWLGPRRARAALASRSLLTQTHARLLTDYPDLARAFEHAPTRTGRLTVAGPMLSAGALRLKMAALLRAAHATLGPVALVRPAGYQPMYANIVRYVTASQTASLGWSVVLVFGLVWGFVRSFRLALLTVVPNLFPVLVVLGAMGWLGIPLDTATASIAALVLGFCVDDTVHFIDQYRQRRLAGDSPEAARIGTIAHTGPAILLTGLLLLGGYSFMMLGSLGTVKLFGQLTALALVGALFGELVIFPLVLARFDR